ncbi:hypothetical protein LTS14_009338 [Recurvomyces mirabilis]|uniref:uncharacterized protein n=1 Tax=Recurvomyces mirabilis TaxID=574656 RepID=UPI002DDDEDB6|nr:hypothetical protein LTS14_009338 [Recurvomyces mirabilis]
MCARCRRIGTRCIYDDKTWTFVDQAAPSDPTPSSSRSSELELAIQAYQLPGDVYYPTLRQASERFQIDADFWAAYLPNDDHSRDAGRGGVSVVPWVPTIRYLASQDNKARLALDSCALMALGRIRNNPQYVQEGLTLYSQALAATNQALRHPVCVLNDSVLACCRILALCEFFRPHVGTGLSTQGTDWQRHIEGTVQLMELRGPEKHVDEHGFVLFADARASAAIAGITRRTKALFSDPRWQEVPWSGRETRRSPSDELADIMAAVSEALEQQDAALDRLTTDSGPISAAQCHAVLDLSERIMAMFRDWEVRMLGTQQQQPPSPQLDEVCMNLGYGSFHLVMQYWATSLIMCSRYWVTLRRLPPAVIASREAIHVPDPQAYADHIAKNAHHCFLPEAGLYGPQKASFPLGAALHYYAAANQHGSVGMQEIRRLFRESETASFTAGFLRSMAADPAPVGIKADPEDEAKHAIMAAEWVGLKRELESDQA